MSTPPFVLIIEDHPLYKQALMGLLRLSFPDHTVCGYPKAEEALAFLQTQAPETIGQSVILLDLTLPGISGLELIARVHLDHPDLQIVVISGSDDPVRVGACMGAGVRAFVSKTTPPDLIVELIGRALRQGLVEQIWLSMEGERSLESIRRIHLTARQMQVLHLVCKGLSNRQIADELQTVEATAKAHVSAILRELGVDSRTQAVLAAQKLGFEGA